MITIAQALETGAVISESVRWLIGQGALGFLCAISLGYNYVQRKDNLALQAKHDTLQASRATDAIAQAEAALKVQTRLVEKISNTRDTGRPRRKESSDDREG